MRRTSVRGAAKTESTSEKAFQLRKDPAAAQAAAPLVHVLKGSDAASRAFRCDTEPRGYPTPGGRSPLEIRINAPGGFIPLWAPDTTLRWRFQQRSLATLKDPDSTQAAIEDLLAAALDAWSDAAPIKFQKRSGDDWDFEIAIKHSDDCDSTGCVLASAFFPDGGRHRLLVYPQMFVQSRHEQVDTLTHEIGHVFGLRHFFANLEDQANVVFGKNNPLSIMNYGRLSELTPADRDDLRTLYDKAWSGELIEINGTPIRFVKPFHESGASPASIVAVAPAASAAVRDSSVNARRTAIYAIRV